MQADPFDTTSQKVRQEYFAWSVYSMMKFSINLDPDILMAAVMNNNDQ